MMFGVLEASFVNYVYPDDAKELSAGVPTDFKWGQQVTI